MFFDMKPTSTLLTPSPQIFFTAFCAIQMVILHLVPKIAPATFAQFESVTNVSIKPQFHEFDIAYRIISGSFPAQSNMHLQ